MKTYKATENLVFAVGKQEYVLKPGDEVELDENHITTRALLERKRIEPLPAPELKTEPPQKPDPASAEAPQPKKSNNSKKD